MGKQFFFKKKVDTIVKEGKKRNVLDNAILLLHSKGAKGNKYQAKLDKLLEAEKARKIKEEAERILKKKQELEKKEAERKRKEEERRRKKYLHACKIGDIDHIKTHRQFYRQYHYGMTGYQSLMLAVQNQRIKVVKYLLDNGGNVSLSLNTEGDNAFHAVVVGLITLDWRDRSLDNGTYRVIREPDERHIEDLLKLLLHHESFSLEAMNRINYT